MLHKRQSLLSAFEWHTCYQLLDGISRVHDEQLAICGHGWHANAEGSATIAAKHRSNAGY
jgi:hypothetical protein